MSRDDATLLTFPIRLESDVALARTRVRAIGALVGLSDQSRNRLAVATSELVRHALRQGRGQLTMGLDDTPPGSLWVEILIHDTKPPRRRALPDRTHGLEGPDAAKKLLEDVARRPHPEGTVYRISRPRQRALPPMDRASVVREVQDHLRRVPASDTAQEIAQQNRELMQMLEQLREQSEALGQANLELEETNRGVVALHAELDARAELLRQSSEIKSRLVSLVGHEFRTPLGSIRMLSELLLEDDEDAPLRPTQRRHVELIHRTAVELAELVDDLLDLSKAQAGKMQLHISTFDVASVLAGLRVLLRPLLRSDEVALSFEPAADLPPMRSDASKVSLILRNLISNALKFTKQGSVRVSARHLPSGRIRFVVADTGVGIHPRDQQRIFEEFSQVENPLQAEVKGTGLGLTLVRRLAEMLGGEVEVESGLGQGSTFTVELPRQYVPGTAVSADTAVTTPAPSPARPRKPPAVVEPPASRPVRPARQGPPRVLVMDDDPSARHVLSHHLRRAGCVVLQAEDGARGLWMARREQPDLIFMDLEMPALSGWEVLPQLRNEQQTRDIPVVLYTGLDAEDAALEGLDAQGVLLKGGDLAGLGKRALAFLHRLVPPTDEGVSPHA